MRRLGKAIVAGLLLASVTVPARAEPIEAPPPAVVQNAVRLGVDPASLKLETSQRVGVYAWEAPRACDRWYATPTLRLDFCINLRFWTDKVGLHGKLHLYYQPNPTGGWLTAPAAQSMTINDWFLCGSSSCTHPLPQTVSDTSVKDFYSGGLYIGCGLTGQGSMNAESFRSNGGTAYLGPGGSAEYVGAPPAQRPC